MIKCPVFVLCSLFANSEQNGRADQGGRKLRPPWLDVHLRIRYIHRDCRPLTGGALDIAGNAGAVKDVLEAEAGVGGADIETFAVIADTDAEQ